MNKRLAETNPKPTPPDVEPKINPEWVKSLEAERDALRVECKCRADWIEKMCAILGYDNSDGLHPDPDPFTIASELKRLAEIGKRWFADSSLETWFPCDAQELQKLKELNEEKFQTINAYCSMASLDRWKMKTLVNAIDRYLSAAGYGEHAKILTYARADVVNAKTGLVELLDKHHSDKPCASI
jgi:hypothetical protein